MTRYRYPWNFDSLRRIPERSGNYAVYGIVPGDLMYHGESGDLRRRMLDHWREHDVGVLPAFVEIELDPNHLSRKKTERDRIQRDHPRYNKEYNDRHW